MTDRSVCIPWFDEKSQFEAFQAMIPPELLKPPLTFEDWDFGIRQREQREKDMGNAPYRIPVDLAAFAVWASSEGIAPSWDSVTEYACQQCGD
ncbi:MAG: hypothetical protein SFU85_12100 [Candidatus Methylacidiphilales bacterium]|nr:hypothetical protein [Candidatus Methylacidiphilales bacterium]